jgi:hypothetical protein
MVSEKIEDKPKPATGANEVFLGSNKQLEKGEVL